MFSTPRTVFYRSQRSALGHISRGTGHKYSTVHSVLRHLPRSTRLARRLGELSCASYLLHTGISTLSSNHSVRISDLG